MFELFVAGLDAADFDEDLAWAFASDDEDIAFVAFGFDVFSLVEGEN